MNYASKYGNSLPCYKTLFTGKSCRKLEPLNAPSGISGFSCLSHENNKSAAAPTEVSLSTEDNRIWIEVYITLRNSKEYFLKGIDDKLYPLISKYNSVTKGEW